MNTVSMFGWMALLCGILLQVPVLLVIGAALLFLGMFSDD